MVGSSHVLEKCNCSSSLETAGLAGLCAWPCFKPGVWLAQLCSSALQTSLPALLSRAHSEPEPGPFVQLRL